MAREVKKLDESMFKTADCITRHPEPVLTYKDVPYKAALTFNAGVLKRENGKYIGLAGSMAEEAIRFWSDFDIDMLVMGADWNFVYESGKSTLANIRKYHIGASDNE